MENEENEENEGRFILSDTQREMQKSGIKQAENMVFRNITISSRSMNVVRREGDQDKYDEITGTAVIATETPVKREIYIPGEGYQFVDEILVMSGINLERSNILPLLKDHKYFNTDYQIGDWSNIRINPEDPTQILGDYRISGDDDNQTFCHRFARGYIKTFSCAYSINGTIQEEVDNNITLRITDWTIYEISAVSVPADFQCSVRSFGRSFRIKGVNKMENEENELNNEANSNDSQGTRSLDNSNNSVSSSDSESHSISANDSALTARAAEIGAPKEFLRNFIGTNVTPEQMTRKFNESNNDVSSSETSVIGRGLSAQPIQIDGRASAHISVMARAFAKTDMARHSGRALDLTNDEASVIVCSPERGMTAKGLLRAVAKRHNVRLPDEVGFDDLYNIRSVAPAVANDFASALSAAITHIQLGGDDLIPYWGSAITRSVEFNSFSSGVFHIPLIADDLIETEQGSEVKAGSFKAYDTQGKLETLNRRYPIARQLFESNGVGLFSNLNAMINNAATTGENKMLQKKILSNPIMSDKTPFFHASRYNVATGVPRSVDGLGKVKAAAFGDGSGVPFVMVLTNPKNQLELGKLTVKPAATEIANINPFGGTFQVIPIPGMPTEMDIWITDPRVRAAILRLRRTGQDAPLMRMIYTATFDGMELLASADRGISHGDPRGAFATFTGEEPEQMPDGSESTYEAEDIEDVLAARSVVDWD